MEISVRLSDSAHRQYSASDAGSYYFVAGVDRDLHDWHAALPEHLRYPPSKLHKPPANYYLLHQQYHTIFILLYRPFLEQVEVQGLNPGNGADGDQDVIIQVARQTCYQHAIQVARIFAAFSEAFDMRTMFVTGMQHAATAAIAIVNGISTGSAQHHQEALKHLQTFADALYVHASVYFPAKVMSNTLFNVIGEHRAKEAQQRSRKRRLQKEQPIPQPNQETDQVTPQHQTQWDDTNPALPNHQTWSELQGYSVDPMADGILPDMTDVDAELWQNILNTLSLPHGE
jgi:hypothetical protein